MGKYDLWVNVESHVDTIGLLRNYNKELTKDIFEYCLSDTYFDSYETAREYIADGGEITVAMLSDDYKDRLVQALVDDKVDFTNDNPDIYEGKVCLNNQFHVYLSVYEDELLFNPLQFKGMTEENVKDMVALFDQGGEFLEVDLAYAYAITNIQITDRDGENPDILYGTIEVNGETYSFEYDYVADMIAYHNYSEPGWFTGSSYEKPLPTEFSDSMSWHMMGIEVSHAAQEYIEKFKTLDERICNAENVVASSGNKGLEQNTVFDKGEYR